ncbi:MAG: hypothetical protein AAFY72_03990 [Cyanobacteria bacterium J06649_4]
MRKLRRLQFAYITAAAVALIATLVYAQPISKWLKALAFIEILDAVSKLGVLVAVAAFLLEIPKRQERAEAERQRTFFEYWRVIDAAAAAGTTTSHA